MRELLLGMPILEVFQKGNAGGQKTRKGKIVIHLIISAKHSVQWLYMHSYHFYEP